MWDFSIDPEFQAKLDWIKPFVKDEVEPMDLVFNRMGHCYDVTDKKAVAALKPLQAEVKRQGLWAPHLSPELGGHGFGNVKLCFINEILGATAWGPRVFGTQAPDTGNSEILAMFGTPAQKARFLQPLLDGDIVSCFSMTEPQGGADPGVFTTRAVREGDQWVINGEKWFSSNACWASFFIIVAVTDPGAPAKDRFSTFLVPAETAGINILSNVGMIGEPEGEGSEGYLRYENVRVPADALLGVEGKGFAVAQARLGGGRLHHAMRTVGACQKALDMMCERALSRRTKGSSLADKGAVQAYIADSAIELQQFRLLVRHAAWICDQGGHGGGSAAAHTAISMVKAATPKVYHDIVQRAMQVHGSLGVTNELPFAQMWLDAAVMGLADGPTEVHKINVAKRLLRDHEPWPGVFPSQHIPPRLAAARQKLSRYL